MNVVKGSARAFRQQAALSVAYGTGSQEGEIVALKVGDIYSKRMTLHVEQGIGATIHCVIRPKKPLYPAQKSHQFRFKKASRSDPTKPADASTDN